MTVTRKWSLLAAVLVVAVLAAGWFLLVSPKRSEAADIKAQTASQEQKNVQLQSEIQQLEAQLAELPKERAKLATIQKQIPNNPALPSLIRDLTDAGRKAGANIDSLAPSPPVAVVADTAPVAPVTTSTTSTDSSTSSESTDSTDSTDSASATAPTTPTAAAPATESTLFAVPIVVKVTGSYFELEQFVSKVEVLQRSFLVNGFTVGEPTGDKAGDGDLTIELKGSVFLAAPSAQPTTATPAPVASTPAAE
jgi:Tfp pilus assembly protein PilO